MRLLWGVVLTLLISSTAFASLEFLGSAIPDSDNDCLGCFVKYYKPYYCKQSSLWYTNKCYTSKSVWGGCDKEWNDLDQCTTYLDNFHHTTIYLSGTNQSDFLAVSVDDLSVRQLAGNMSLNVVITIPKQGIKIIELVNRNSNNVNASISMFLWGTQTAARSYLKWKNTLWYEPSSLTQSGFWLDPIIAGFNPTFAYTNRNSASDLLQLLVFSFNTDSNEIQTSVEPELRQQLEALILNIQAE